MLYVYWYKFWASIIYIDPSQEFLHIIGTFRCERKGCHRNDSLSSDVYNGEYMVMMDPSFKGITHIHVFEAKCTTGSVYI